jgi:hypothetical protein
VRLLESIATTLYYVDQEREGRVAHAALDLAERADLPGMLAAAMRAIHLWQTHQPEAREERLMIAQRANALARSAQESAGLRLVVQRNLVVDLLENQEINEFETALGAYEESAQTLGSPRDIYWSMALRAAEATMHGDLTAAEQLARGAMLRGHELDQISDGAYFLQRFVVRYEQGRLAEEAPALQQIETVNTVYRAGAALHAVALADLGQPERAVALARGTIGPDGSGLPRDAFWLAGMSLFAGVAADAADRELAELLRTLLAPCADHVVLFGAGAAVLGSGHQWIGSLAMTVGDTGAALDHFAAAAAIAEKLSAPYWTAQAKIGTAIALRSSGQPNDGAQATSLIEEAVAIATSRGYGRVLLQADALG